MDDRVHAVEIALGKLDQLLAVFDRLRCPTRRRPRPATATSARTGSIKVAFMLQPLLHLDVSIFISLPRLHVS